MPAPIPPSECIRLFSRGIVELAAAQVPRIPGGSPNVAFSVAGSN